MRIKVISIAKKDKMFDDINANFIKMSQRFAKVEDIVLFDKKTAKAQQLSQINEAKKSYTNSCTPYLGRYNVALDVVGKRVDSFDFAKILDDKLEVNFFIGGAYGFEREFVNSCDMSISLSDLTLSHQIAKNMLFEQIFRGLSINNNHPYHK
jgi:23S rRNA (pseudouridine1915-N3)-methyltransferase